MFQKLFHSHGKLLLSGEYFVMDGALALVLPVQLGQDLRVEVVPSKGKPRLDWRSLDDKGRCWFEACFDLEKLNLIKRSEKEGHQALYLQRLLKEARAENQNFLSNEPRSLKVITSLEFPRNWGLGSSSTLIYNMAHWACISPFNLKARAGIDGSGFDLASAHGKESILYQKKKDGPTWSTISFNPSFASHIYFVYLGKKQSTQEAIEYYRSLSLDNRAELVDEVSAITQSLSRVEKLLDFEELLREHEKLVSRSLGLLQVKDILFSDYWGVVKSLGAWGGDFVLVTSNRTREETFTYFKQKGFGTCLTYQEMVGDDYGSLH